MKKKIFTSLFLILTTWTFGSALSIADYPLLPLPQAVTPGSSAVVIDKAEIFMPEWQTEWTDVLTNLGIRISPNAKYKITGAIVSHIDGAPEGNDESYSLDITRKGITVKATSGKGIYWALQTLRQIISASSGKKIPECSITDYPAFPWRGFMMDTGRTFISMEELKREISIMSQFKLNIFHWHLTENQAWRLESKIFPMLNDSCNIERQPGLYYTLDQAKELVSYAKAHNIMLVPEIDMPGHSAAFVKTFRHDMQRPEGEKILKLLVDEVCETFDVPYLHIGTDEVNFTNPDFVPEMVAFVRERGKKVISWNPGWNYSPGEIDLTTMWSYRGKPFAGIPAVDLRFHYINHFDTYSDLRALYRSNVYGHKQAEDGVIGVEIALWNDRYVEDEKTLIAQNSVYPALLAVAERSWHGGGEEYFDSLGVNLNQEQTADFDNYINFENRLLWHKTHTLDSIYIPYVRQGNIRWLITDAFPNGGDLTKVFPPETEGLKELYTYGDSTYFTNTANGASVQLRHYWGKLIPAFYSDPQPDHTAYAFTWVYAPHDMTVGLQAETQNYSRSESDIAPPPGKWDYRESKIMINNKEIPAPEWTSNHTTRSIEITLGYENFAARKPIEVKLHKGWNEVLIKLPVGQFSTKETRLVKWMFTFAFTTPDGKESAPGLIYSPYKSLKR